MFLNTSVTSLLILAIGVLSGCVTTSSEERSLPGETIVFKPHDPSTFDHLNVSWAKAADGHDAISFNITEHTVLDEYRQPTIQNQVRRTRPGLMLAGVNAIMFPVTLAICADQHRSCFESTTEEWRDLGDPQSNGQPNATGQAKLDTIPLQESYAGTLKIVGYDERGKEMGKYQTGFTFSSANSVALSHLLSHFRSRPSRLTIAGDMQIRARHETFELVADRDMVAQFNFGYAWMTGEEVKGKMRNECIKQCRVDGSWRHCSPNRDNYWDCQLEGIKDFRECKSHCDEN